jgi:copper chaperone CopZ
MKTKLIIVSIATLFATSFANTAFAAPKTIQIGLDGLVCAFCAQGVEKKMKAQAATDKVFVSLDKKVAVVALKDGKDIPDATIKAEITDAGYVVKSIARSEESFDAVTKKIKDSK